MLRLLVPPVDAGSDAGQILCWIRELETLRAEPDAHPEALAMVEWRLGEARGWLRSAAVVAA